jgi:hypothetical protein
MLKGLHTFFLLLLLILTLSVTIGVGLNGADYYLTSLEERPYHPQYDELKPTGLAGHGFGIVGSLMIIAGVLLYSSRKRMPLLSALGRIKYFLEFHIFLCLTGPILVLFHTTFKFGGLVAVSFWSMTAVVLSGVVGRYLFMQIPKGIRGNELTAAELIAENEKLAEMLRRQYGLRAEIIRRIDAIAFPHKPVGTMSLTDVVRFFLVNDLTRRVQLRTLYSHLKTREFTPAAIRKLRTIASKRIVLTRRIAFLGQFQKIFHYWHVIHLPFSIVMFVILSLHVGVAITFGYRWVF